MKRNRFDVDRNVKFYGSLLVRSPGRTQLGDNTPIQCVTDSRFADILLPFSISFSISCFSPPSPYLLSLYFCLFIQSNFPLGTIVIASRCFPQHNWKSCKTNLNRSVIKEGKEMEAAAGNLHNALLGSALLILVAIHASTTNWKTFGRQFIAI